MSNKHWPRKPVENQVQEFVADASLAIEIGDLMYHDVNDAKPASSQADQLSEEANQRMFAANFAGVAISARRSTDAEAGVVRILTDGLYEFDCASDTYEHGDLVGPSENGGGTGLLDQQVEKVSNLDLAIGVAIERKASASTKIWCRLINKKADLATRNGSQGVSDYYTATRETAVDDTATVTAAQLLKRIIDAVPTAAATFTLPTAALLVAAMPGVKVGDTFEFIITNNSAGANTITVAAGSGGTADGTLTVAQNVVRKFVVHVTNVTAASEAYFVYGIG
jgi:hypothetical protein